MLIRKTFKFEAAHRLLNSYTKRCRGVHGHSYRVEVVLSGNVEEDLDRGMVLDFTRLREELGEFIDRFDHTLILSHKDTLAAPEKLALLALLNPRFVVVPYEPTAEMMASHIFEVSKYMLESARIPCKVSSVRVHETETGYAECFEGDVLSVPFHETHWSAAIMFE